MRPARWPPIRKGSCLPQRRRQRGLAERPKHSPKPLALDWLSPLYEGFALVLGECQLQYSTAAFATKADCDVLLAVVFVALVCH